MEPETSPIPLNFFDSACLDFGKVSVHTESSSTTHDAINLDAWSVSPQHQGSRHDSHVH